MARGLGVAPEGLVGAREVVEQPRHPRELVGALELREGALIVADVEELQAPLEADLGLGGGLRGRADDLGLTWGREEERRRDRRDCGECNTQGKHPPREQRW